MKAPQPIFVAGHRTGNPGICGKGTTSPLDQTSSPLMTTEGLNQLADLNPTFMKDPKKGHQEGNISQALGRQHFSFLLKKNVAGKNPSLVSHPPHVSLPWLSALIPLCAYKTDLNFSKNPLSLPGTTFPFCSSILPTLLDGQLCYKLTTNITRLNRDIGLWTS